MKFRIPKLPKLRRSKPKEKSLRRGLYRLHCNLCNHVFSATSRFSRFCFECKRENEAYRFNEWLVRA